VNDKAPRDETAPVQESAVDAALLHYVRDPALWPVLMVLVLVAATLGASLLLFAVLERNLFALTALVLLVLMSVHAVADDVRKRRFGVAPRVVIALWAASAAVAAGINALGVF